MEKNFDKWFVEHVHDYVTTEEAIKAYEQEQYMLEKARKLEEYKANMKRLSELVPEGHKPSELLEKENTNDNVTNNIGD